MNDDRDTGEELTAERDAIITRRSIQSAFADYQHHFIGTLRSQSASRSAQLLTAFT
jgi:hypothetical protein